MNLLSLARALSNPTRLALLGALAVKPMTVTEAAAAVRVSPSTASVGLAELRAAGLLDEVWRGREHLYKPRLRTVTIQIGGAAAASGEASRTSFPDARTGRDP